MLCPCIYYHIDATFHTKIIRVIFNEGYSNLDISNRCYGFPYEIVHGIAKAFEEDGHQTPKAKGGNCLQFLGKNISNGYESNMMLIQMK
jgi:hypothetical protein